MALSLDLLQRQIKTSIYGKRLGLDYNDYLVGQLGTRAAVEDVTSTVSSSLIPYGISNFTTAVNSSAYYTLQAMQIGATKIITQTATSTLGILISAPTGAWFQTTLGTSLATTLSLYGKGALVTLTAVSSIFYVVTGTLQTVSSVSTSTA